MKKIFSPLAVILLLLAASAGNSLAQNTLSQPVPSSPQLAPNNANALALKAAANSPATVAVINSLSTLPEADVLIYVNPQRILNEVLPKFLPAKDLENMRQGFEEARKSAGIDPAKVEYLVVAVRFQKPTADLNFQAPEFMMVTGGDFSADSLLALAHVAAQGKLRDETYSNRTIGLMTIDPIANESEKTPLLKSFTEMGIVALNANTIAIGSPGYLRAAIDAADGRERISPEALNALVRDPNALISFAGSPWHSFAKSFGMLGTVTSPRAQRCETRLGETYAALTMDDSNFMLRGFTNADNPDTAKIVANLYSALLQYATTSIPDPGAKSVLKQLVVKAEGDEILLQADFPQQMVIDVIQEQLKAKPKKPEDAEVTQPHKRPVKGRRSRRRH